MSLILWITNKWIGRYYARNEQPPDWLGDIYEWAYWRKHGKKN